ncbi:MAG: hypothetical protein ABFR65_12050 [Pseudomonadota bacterium]
MAISVFSAKAEPQHVCNNLQLNQQAVPLEFLQTMAERCELPELIKLYANRARLHELMAEYNYLNMAVSADRASHAYYQAYRILLGLAEAFAAEAFSRGDRSAVSHLNNTYSQYIEITELRLRGYDLIANRIEQGVQ